MGSRTPQQKGTKVRAAALADCDAIAVVRVETWRTTYRGLLPDAILDALSAPARADMWRRALQRTPPRLLFVAEREGRLVGFGAAGPPSGAALGADSEVHALYVS